MLNRIFALLLLLVCSSCFNYETQFEGPYSEEAGEEAEEYVFPKEVVYVAGGKVYLANQFAKDSLVIENSGQVKVASINNNHTKVIYKRDNQNIQIYDIEMEQVSGEVPNSQTAFWFDFHANNETIYFFTFDDQLHTYGPEVLSRQPINLRTHSGIFGDVRGGVVLENGEILFSMEFNGVFNTHYLVWADGDEVFERREENISKTDMRLNASENVFWSTDIYDNFLYSVRIPGFSSLDFDSQFSLGAPTDGGSGYKITEDNEIYTPEFVTIDSPGGEITSIDH